MLGRNNENNKKILLVIIRAALAVCRRDLIKLNLGGQYCNRPTEYASDLLWRRRRETKPNNIFITS